jgi:hypothetical protein
MSSASLDEMMKSLGAKFIAFTQPAREFARDGLPDHGECLADLVERGAADLERHNSVESPNVG